VLWLVIAKHLYDYGRRGSWRDESLASYGFCRGLRGACTWWPDSYAALDREAEADMNNREREIALYTKPQEDRNVGRRWPLPRCQKASESRFGRDSIGYYIAVSLRKHRAGAKALTRRLAPLLLAWLRLWKSAKRPNTGLHCRENFRLLAEADR
jgi:hypothetical protein